MSIPVFRPSIKRNDMKAVLSCLVSEEIAAGADAVQLSRALLKMTGYGEGALLRERLRGLEIALKCLDLPEGGRVALSPLSDLSYLHALEALRLEPVYIDSRGDCPAMDMEALEREHRERPLQGLILEHHLGFSPDMKILTELKIPLVQDLSWIISSGRPSTADRSQEVAGEGEEAAPETTVAAAGAAVYMGEVCLVSLEVENLITAGGGIFIASRKKKGLKPILSHYPEDIYLSDMNASLGNIQLQELDKFLNVRGEILDVLRHTPMAHRFLLPEGRPTCLSLLLNSSMQEVISYGMKHQVEIQPAFKRSIIQSMLKSFDTLGSGEDSPAERYPESAGFSLKTVLLPLYPGLRKRDLEIVQKIIKTLP